MEISIPKDFIIGAAASAWQTEGRKGKKQGKTLLSTAGIKTNGSFGMKAMVQPWRQISWKIMRKISR